MNLVQGTTHILTASLLVYQAKGDTSKYGTLLFYLQYADITCQKVVFYL